jgi:uncharacterized membrane protein YozB (DUF420 family)
VSDPKAVLAAVNASLNATSAVLLILAYVSVKRRNYRAHASFIISALIVSSVFLCFYLTSHWRYGERSSGLPPGTLKTVYLLILLPHIFLAVGMLPLIALALYRAYRRDWLRHRRIARWALGIWMYVSVTGVVVYWMLYHLFPGLKSG